MEMPPAIPGVAPRSGRQRIQPAKPDVGAIVISWICFCILLFVLAAASLQLALMALTIVVGVRIGR